MIELNKGDIIKIEGQKFKIKGLNLYCLCKMKDKHIKTFSYKQGDEHIKIDNPPYKDNLALLEDVWERDGEEASLELERVKE